MTILGFLIPLALVCGVLALYFFFWAMRSGQFEDLDGAANRILIDEEP
ncbi:cbb3-type cytochrome oxidase assembly protein CcoS [Novosphingobium sp. FGD1]|jgi:cbb3-type cytochrome oxidase maturation protein|uniref:Cbb3-type cytochrome oxidase assembly protein CcoS n=1 Tax=Novosphingobium silvae TaxID=2692619 RepID=A0A7X4GL81_9SPHN|nr:cbb3-type cytochrome oxidase assembly protein CcoS [Novosphingobium silvae]MYL99674.1 cbb3-type cytochrome oxidase assembly protein CcoS [Novosphingobium silvae]